MKKFITLGTTLATGLISVAGIVSCGPNNKTPKKPEGGTTTGGTGTTTGGTGTTTGGTGTTTGGTGTTTGGTGTTTGGTGTKDVRKKVIWHLQSYYNGKVIKGVTFSPATFELPKSISVKDFVRRIHEFGTRNGKEGWWYKSTKGDAITVYTITLGDLTITASFDGKTIKTGGKDGDGPARNTHYTLFDKDNKMYTTVDEINKRLLSKEDKTTTPTTGGTGTTTPPVSNSKNVEDLIKAISDNESDLKAALSGKTSEMNIAKIKQALGGNVAEGEEFDALIEKLTLIGRPAIGSVTVKLGEKTIIIKTSTT